MLKNNDLSKILKKQHENQWVALSKDCRKVVGFSSSLISLEKKVGTKKVIYMKAPPSGVIFAF